MDPLEDEQTNQYPVYSQYAFQPHYPIQYGMQYPYAPTPTPNHVPTKVNEKTRQLDQMSRNLKNVLGL